MYFFGNHRNNGICRAAYNSNSAETNSVASHSRCCLSRINRPLLLRFVIVKLVVEACGRRRSVGCVVCEVSNKSDDFEYVLLIYIHKK